MAPDTEGVMAHAGRIDLTEEQRARLEEMARSQTLAARIVLRAKIVLRRAQGESCRTIGLALDCDHRTAWQWARRWEAAGFEGIEQEQAGRGRKSWVVALKGQEIVQNCLIFLSSFPSPFILVHPRQTSAGYTRKPTTGRPSHPIPHPRSPPRDSSPTSEPGSLLSRS